MKQNSSNHGVDPPDVERLKKRIRELENLKRRYRRDEIKQTALYRIADAAFSAADMPELYRTLHKIIGELIFAKNFYISFFDEKTRIISWPYFVDEYDQAPAPRTLKKGLTEYVLLSGKPLLASYETFKDLLKNKEIESILKPPAYWLGVPLIKNNKTFGVLCVQSYTRKHPFTEEDKALLTFVSQQIATTLQRKMAEEALRRSEQKLSILSNQMEHFSRAAVSILSNGNDQALFTNISQAIADHSDYQRVIISLFKEQFPFREIIGFAGVDPEIIKRLRGVEMPKTWYDDVFLKGEKIGPLSYYIPHTLKDILNQEATVFGNGPVIDDQNAWHPEDNLFVTMNDKNGDLVGIISVDDSKSGLKPCEDTVRPLEIFASFIAQVILIKKERDEKHILEIRLRQAHKMESIGTLAGGIAHDFNNILSIILGNTELALDEVRTGDPAFDNINEIKTASLRAKDIVRQLLSFSRKTKTIRSPLDPVSIVQESVKLIRASIPSSIEILLECDDIHQTVMADATQIHQVMINLCTNAADAMRDTGGQLAIRLSIHIQPDHPAPLENEPIPAATYIKLTVSDTGPGIDARTREKIFDPYFTTKKIGKGTGMGLSVVHGIVKSHNGHIRVETEPGKGTRFHVYLPVSGRKPDQTSGLQEKTDRYPKGSETILFIDDEPAIVQLTKKMLTRLGYTVIADTDPLEALKIIESGRCHVDLVMTDMTMPRIDGAELACRIKENFPGLPVIICTGYHSGINDRQAKKIGAARLCMKPLSMKDIAVTLRRILDNKIP